MENIEGRSSINRWFFMMRDGIHRRLTEAVGHHGSSTSSIMSMVNHVSPKYAVISIGENNRYGHPSEKIVQRWVDIGAEVFRSDESRAVIITVDGEEMSINPMIP